MDVMGMGTGCWERGWLDRIVGGDEERVDSLMW